MSVTVLGGQAPVAVQASETGGAVYANSGPDVVFYGATRFVSSGAADGSIGVGASVTLLGTQYLVLAAGAARADVGVTAVAPSAGSGGVSLIPTAEMATNYTAAVSDFVRVDATAASRTITLPSAPPDKTTIGVKMVKVAGAFSTTILTSGSDVLNKAGGPTSRNLTVLNEAVLLQYDRPDGIWFAVANDLPLTSLAAVSVSTPNPDTTAGTAGTANTFAAGDHSHPKSTLYDTHGFDDLNIVNTSGATQTVPNPAANQSSYIRLTANCAITMPTPTAGARFTLALAQGGAGSNVPSFGAHVGFVGGVTPTWSTTAGLMDVVKFACFDGTNWMATGVTLGLAVPPNGMTIVQSAATSSATTMTLPSPVTAGNAVLIFYVDNNAYTGSGIGAPSGGGCTNWAEVGAPVQADFTPKSGEIWMGTNSAGGAGSNTINFHAAKMAYVMEVAGPNPTWATALDGSVISTDQTLAANNEVDNTTALTAPRAGDMVFVVVWQGSNTTIQQVQGQATGTAGVYTAGAWTIVMPVNAAGAGNTTLMTIAYQLNTVNAATYQVSVKGWVSGNTWHAKSFTLRS